MTDPIAEARKRLSKNKQAKQPEQKPVVSVVPEWPEAIPLDETTLAAPVFPLEVFPPQVADYCRSVQASIRCAPDYVAGAVLAVAAAAIGATAEILVKDSWTEQAGSLYLGLVGDPSQKKTPPQKHVLKPLQEEHNRRMRILEEREAADRKKRKLAYSGSDTDPIEEAARVYDHDEGEMVVSSATTEGLARVFRKQRRGVAYIRNELTGWFNGLNQYRSSGKGDERATFLEIYDGGVLTTLRKEKTLSIKGCCLTLCGGVQPDVLAPFFKERDGLAARFLWIYPELRTPGAEDWVEISTDLTNQWRSLVWSLTSRRMIEIESEGAIIRVEPERYLLSDKARKSWTEFTAWQSVESTNKAGDNYYREFAGKLEAIGLRLSLIMRLLYESCGDKGQPRVVQSADVERAGILCKYFAGMARRVYGVSWLDARLEPALWLHEWLQSNGQPSFSRAQAWRAARNKASLFRKPEDLLAPLKFLQEHNLVRELPQELGSVGRTPTATYAVHPSLLGQQGEG